MAIPAKPKKKKKAIDASVVTENLEKPSPSQMVAMNFKIPYEFRKEFFLYAMENDISGTELLKRAFEYYRKNN